MSHATSVTDPFGGADEYPLDSGGTRIVPEVVAWGRVEAGNADRRRARTE